MATYAGTPTIVQQWEEGDRNGKRIRVRKVLSIVLATQGGATNTITLVALGLKALATTSNPVHFTCISFTDGGSQLRAVWLFTDGTNLYVGDPTQATDANRAIPADVTGTLVFEVAAFAP